MQQINVENLKTKLNTFNAFCPVMLLRHHALIEINKTLNQYKINELEIECIIHYSGTEVY